MDDKVTACSFTGHRKIEERHKGKIDALIMRAINYVYGLGCRKFYTGGAVGFDTLAAKQVILFRMTHPEVELHLILPCANQSDGWEASLRDVYEYTLSNADSVTVLEDSYTSGCMKRRNIELVRLSDAVVAYLGHERSGASQTVRLAKGAGKKVYNLFPTLEKEL